MKKSRGRVRATALHLTNIKSVYLKMTDVPMFSVTVMMLRLIVESVMLLKDEDWKSRGRQRVKRSTV